MRLDVFLAENGYAGSRQRAKVLITEGFVKVGERVITKPSYEVDENAEIKVSGDPIGYVSRGALKLKAAFETFALSADGLIAADIGASTGGFTQYLLERGARKVYAVDSGTNQLAEVLLNDDRVVSMEKYNARNLCPADFDGGVDIAVMDVSFISQTLIIPSLSKILKDDSLFVTLIKPQFEAGREAVGKGGIVKNPASRAKAIRKVIDCVCANGLEFQGLTVSPILGGDGNTEYLACFAKGKYAKPINDNIDILISRFI